jgi:catechol 2,3-dioxygenase-like lactoylglutathione lyase family enzyme
MTDAIKQITIGVADLDDALKLWCGRFGLDVIARQAGPDTGLGILWDVPADRIADQALVGTPGAGAGWLHLVQFAGTTDLGPKSLDVHCRDMPARYAELGSDGYRFRAPISEYEVGDLRAREAQMPAHDDTNVVLIEVFGWDIRLSDSGYGGVTSFVVVVPDAKVEGAFYTELFDLDELMHHRITGPAIEQAVGLPKGSTLIMRLLGRETEMFGRMELVQYEGLAGTDRFPLAKAPALGTLHCGFQVDSLEAFVERAGRAGAAVRHYGSIQTISGSGRAAAVDSPAGLRVEVFEPSVE